MALASVSLRAVCDALGCCGGSWGYLGRYITLEMELTEAEAERDRRGELLKEVSQYTELLEVRIRQVETDYAEHRKQAEQDQDSVKVRADPGESATTHTRRWASGRARLGSGPATDDGFDWVSVLRAITVLTSQRVGRSPLKWKCCVSLGTQLIRPASVTPHLQVSRFRPILRGWC